jgi:plasmid maintenance system killer protein
VDEAGGPTLDFEVTREVAWPGNRFEALKGNRSLTDWSGKKLDRLEAATSITDLAVLPGNRFEALKRKTQRAVQHTDQRPNGACVLNGPTGRRAEPTGKLLIITK